MIGDDAFSSGIDKLKSIICILVAEKEGTYFLYLIVLVEKNLREIVCPDLIRYVTEIYKYIIDSDYYLFIIRYCLN